MIIQIINFNIHIHKFKEFYLNIDFYYIFNFINYKI